jgi:hypothetical protein
LFVVAVVLMASAPSVLLQPDQETRTELNRWFLTVAGSADAITACVLLALAQRPHRTLLIVDLAVAAIVAGAIILPIQPSFAAILAVGVVPLIAYPYWRVVRMFPSWWAGTSRALVILAALAGAALLVTAAIAFPRQIGGTDPAARGGWWSDYAEHATVLALAGVLAASRGPGCRILRGLCSAVWLYPGLCCAPDSLAPSRIVRAPRRRRGAFGTAIRRRRLGSPTLTKGVQPGRWISRGPFHKVIEQIGQVIVRPRHR